MLILSRIMRYFDLWPTSSWARQRLTLQAAVDQPSTDVRAASGMRTQTRWTRALTGPRARPTSGAPTPRTSWRKAPRRRSWHQNWRRLFRMFRRLVSHCFRYTWAGFDSLTILIGLVASKAKAPNLFVGCLVLAQSIIRPGNALLNSEGGPPCPYWLGISCIIAWNIFFSISKQPSPNQ